jgi:protoporphyrinogen oxidase
MYPKLGPGQLWEYVAETVQKKGGCVMTGWNVEQIHADGNQVKSVLASHPETGEQRTFEADYFFSTMPVKELIHALDSPIPANVQQVSDGLMYRDFITVGLLLKRLQVRDDSPAGAKLLSDNWIYIQEPDVLVGRMQIFNNWSPYMVADPSLVWVGLEYFCYDTDDLWKKPDADMISLAKEEVERIGIISREDVVDATVIRMPKTYPAYFGTYDRFGEIRDYMNGFENLFLVGRNGMHKYNNQDHSMLTAMTAVDNIAAGVTDKSNLWAVNTEMEYHEEKEK